MNDKNGSIMERVFGLLDAQATANGGNAAYTERSETAREFIEFMDEIPGGFLIYREGGDESILHANKALIKIFGCENLAQFKAYTSNSFKGMVLPEDLDEVEKSIERQIKSHDDNLDRVEYRIRRLDGEIRWVEDHGHLIRTAALGNVYYVFISDVTEDRLRRDRETAALMDARERKYRNIIEEYDLERKLINQEHLRRLEVIEGLSVNYESILYVNLAADRVLPYRLSARTEKQFGGKFIPISYADFVNDYVDTWVLPDDKTEIRKILSSAYLARELKTEKTYYANYRVVLNGKLQHIQVRIVNVGDEKAVSQAVLGFRCIDEELERVRMQTRVLEEALSAARNADAAKSTFLSNMSHDMRTPLNAIFGYTSIAKKAAADPAAVESYLDKIDASGKQLLDLIDKVLLVSQTESLKLELEEKETDLSMLVRAHCEDAKKEADAKNLTLKTNCDGVSDEKVVCDGEKLGQVLDLLISNAVKYTPDGGKVTVSAKRTKTLPNGYATYELSVADNGIGLDDELKEKIFTPFVRGSDTTKSGVFGVGLGLTIAKRITDAMSGTIGVTSTRGKGSTFTVALNLKTVSSPTESEKKAELKGTADKIILVTDDNEINLEVETEILGELGFTVETAADGAEAYDKVLSSKPNKYAFVLMDVQMPIMDGRKATEMIRSIPDKKKSKLPIIALSANAFDTDVKRSLECGMDAHLSKPLDVDELMKTVSEIINKRK